MKVYNYISMLFLAGAAIVASCSQNEELTGETPDSLQGFQISVSDEGFMARHVLQKMDILLDFLTEMLSVYFGKRRNGGRGYQESEIHIDRWLLGID